MSKRYTVEEITNMIKKDGWFFNRSKGSHFHYAHPTKVGIVTIPNHKGVLNPKIANSILKQAGLK